MFSYYFFILLLVIGLTDYLHRARLGLHRLLAALLPLPVLLNGGLLLLSQSLQLQALGDGFIESLNLVSQVRNVWNLHRGTILFLVGEIQEDLYPRL